jgi:integrase
MPKPNRPELALLRGKRTEQSLESWTQAFAEGDPELAERYALAASSFTGRSERSTREHYEPYIGTLSPATRRSYAYALTEFFEWIASKYGRVVPPHKVTRKDAEDFVHWLATRPYSLEAEKLRDGDQENRREIYETLKALGSADLSSIAANLPERIRKEHVLPNGDFDGDWLYRTLGRMTLHDFVVRTPTLTELRKDDARIGISVFVVKIPDDQGGVEEISLRDIFAYSLPKPRAVSRVTISLRLAALCSFWDALMQGENVDDAAILRFNIFRSIAKRVRLGLGAEKKAVASRKKHLTPEMVGRMLRAADGPSLSEKRDAALLWFLVLTGARITEVTMLRRGRPSPSEMQRWPGWFDGRAEPPSIEIVRKGGSRYRLPFPPYALKALTTFQAELQKSVPPQGTQSTDPREWHYLPATAPEWRFKALAEEPDAPLFPPVSFWGANSAHNYQEFKPNANVRPDYKRAMSRHGVDATLKRIAKKAGFTDEEQALAHGHSFRHFAATAMAREGKPIREIQQILGHDSITTTERYIAAETSAVALSGQNEILDYISKGMVPDAPTPPEPEGPKPEVEAPRQPPVRAPAPRTEVIETYGVPVPAREQPAPARPMRHELPSRMPAQAPVVFDTPEVHATKEGLVALVPGQEPPLQVIETRKGISPGDPYESYRGIEPPVGAFDPEERVAQQESLHFTMINRRLAGKAEAGLANLARPGDKRDLVQQEPWLRKHYDPWPLNYGIGENSLLPWYARGSASMNGEVTVDVLDKNGKKSLAVVPPLPVLSRSQMYPDLSAVKLKKLWQQVEQLRTDWLRTAPTKAFGLDRWWGAFLKILQGLEYGTGGKFPWVAFNGLAKVGTNIRAHDDEYVLEWLRLNAERYTTTIRAFEKLQRPRGKGDEDARFSDVWKDASVIGVSPAEEIPDWFIADDPVRDIYDNNPEEFEWFVKWIGAITGQHLTDVRKEALAQEESAAKKEQRQRVDQARAMLSQYYDVVKELRETREDREAHAGAKELQKVIVERLNDYGIPDPKILLKKGVLKRGQRIEASIETLLGIAFPKADVDVVNANVLQSQIFDADTFRLDTDLKTVVHTEKFKKAFAERYDARDSECVVRRAARGMWEHVKRHGIPIERGLQRSSSYSMLYSVMLSYMAWILPCPEEIEQRMAKQGVIGDDARMQWLTGFKQSVARIVRATETMDQDALRTLATSEGLDAKSAAEVQEAVLVQDSLTAQVALPPQEVEAKLVESAVKSGQVMVTIGGATVRRRAAVTVRRAETSEPEQQPVARKERLHVPERAAEGARRRAVVEVVPEAEGPPVGTYLSVGPEPESDEPLTPNAPPHRYMDEGAYALGVSYVENAERVMPSALRMMAAMTMRF